MAQNVPEPMDKSTKVALAVVIVIFITLLIIYLL